MPSKGCQKVRVCILCSLADANAYSRAVKFSCLLDTLHNFNKAKKHQFDFCPQFYKTWIFYTQMAWCKKMDTLKLIRNMHELVIYSNIWNIPSKFFESFSWGKVLFLAWCIVDGNDTIKYFLRVCTMSTKWKYVEFWTWLYAGKNKIWKIFPRVYILI